MRIGITYDLRSEYLAMGLDEEETAELDREDTIEGISEALRSLGHVPDAIGHVKALAGRLVRGDRWDLVFNIAEGIYGSARESQVPALLDAYEIPYTFSDPLVLGIALQKDLAKVLVAAQGIRTPEHRVVRCMHDVGLVDLSYPIFAKPVAKGTSKGVTAKSLVRAPEDLEACCRDLLERFRQPVLLERFLPGREVTVGITGTGDRAEVLGTLEVLLLADAEQSVYSYDNKKHFEGRVEYRLVRGADDPEVAEAEALALGAWRALGCRDAGRVDVRSDEYGRPSFIEVNPLAGLNPTISDLAILARLAGLEYRALVERILRSAAERIPSEGARACA